MSKLRNIIMLLPGILVVFYLLGPLKDTGDGEGSRDIPADSPTRTGERAKRPSDWFFAQRAYPRGEVNLDVYRDEVRRALEMRNRDAAPLPGQGWVEAGPTNIGGRITTLAIDPVNSDIVYAGAASGGVLKSTDGGETWTPLFDEQPTLSIGSVAVDPSNPDVIYAGTGEANAGGGSVTYGGLGVFKSSDGGLNWQNVGLGDTRYTGKVIVDPLDPDRVYVAATGTLFSLNSARGVYRSTDAGMSWDHVLFVSDSTGAIDIVQDPVDTDVIYAAMWERRRTPDSRRYGGRTSGVVKSTDGGESWTYLAGGLPSGADVGRIGLALSAANHTTLYAIYADDTGYFMGVYKSLDSGENWARVNDTALQSGYFYSSYGWWFGTIVADPTDENIVYADGITMYKSTDGGASWFEIAWSNHVDHHAIAIDPWDHNRVIEGNDGGVYTSTNGGTSWNKSLDLPVTQFYTGEIDHSSQDRLYGGAQDNGTLRTWDGAVDDWEEIFGGDGFYVLVDPTNSNTIYAEYQYGALSKSTNGGLTFRSVLDGVNSNDRRNWATPVAIAPSDPDRLYYGTYRLYGTTDGAGYWTAISGDQTNGPGGGNLVFGTITTIAVAPSDPRVIYSGTDDGNVWVTFDGGQVWNDIGASLPERWVTRVAVDPRDPLKAYVTLSGFRWDSPLPHVFKTLDGGSNWDDISGGLPEVPVNDIVIDPQSGDYLYVGTDTGVYRSSDGGVSWEDMNDGLPVVPVTDLTLHSPTRTLSAATYGRSMFTVILPPPVRVEGSLDPVVAGGLSMRQNYPNPFNPSTAIRFELAAAARVNLKIYDLHGKQVRVLLDGHFSGGGHEVVWNGRDDLERSLPSGPYIYRLAAGDRVITRKMLLLR